MPFTLDSVVPWGRSFDEYVEMFQLSPADLDRSILGCADGPASFNAEMHARGRRVVSIDPLYRFSAAQIKRRINETFPTMIEQLRQNLQDYVWMTRFRSPEELGRHRRETMELFLEDYNHGRKKGRYIAGSIEALPISGLRYDLALCSHFLFLYSDRLSPAFHVAAIEEMMRCAREVRIFPILTLSRQPSPHLPSVLEQLERAGCMSETVTVDYEFQKGGNQMLRVW